MTSYFSDTATERSGDGRYSSLDSLPVVDAGDGVTLRPLGGQRLLLSHVTVAPHGTAAVHTHDEEQMGLVVEGECEFSLDGDVRTLTVGDIYHAPPGVPHGVVAGAQGCVIVDLFSPPRRALLDLVT
jgi:quercetin dioxygenase-like cupin family protein